MGPVKGLTVSLLCVSWLLGSCGGKSGANVVGNPTLQSITVSPPSATVAVGQTQQFTATANYSDGSSKQQAAMWTTSVPTVTNVSSTGLVTAVGQGRFSVFATIGTRTASATLTVGPPSETITDELGSRCPAPSKEIQAACREITYEDLPEGARALLRELKCDVGAKSPYNYGTAVDLNGDGTPEYEFCCHEAPHGPCSAVVIGRVEAKWRDLTGKGGLLGYEGPCKLFIVLETKHRGFHDICLPNECSPPFKTGTCNQTIWHFDGTRYHLAEMRTRDLRSK